MLDQKGIDAIIGAIPPSLKSDGHLNQAIIAAAGQQMDQFIVENIFRPRSGDVFAVPPFNIPVRHILYAVLPVWKDGIGTEDRDLTRCYRGVIELSIKMGLKRIALPALGTGVGKFPVKRAARLGVQGIIDQMSNQIEEIRIVCNNRENFDAFEEWLVHYGWTGVGGEGAVSVR